MELKFGNPKFDILYKIVLIFVIKWKPFEVNSNKAGLFEGSFFCGGVNLMPPPPTLYLRKS